MLAVWKRELQAYFFTPVGYVYMGVFLTLSSVMFYVQIMQARSSDLITFLGQMGYLWMLLCPVLTMRLLAEEKQKRTDQLLLTSPVSLPGMVLGKFLAAATVMLLTVALTLLYVMIVAVYGEVYPGELLVGYLGFILQGCAFLSVDLFASALVASPVTAALLGFGANLCLWMMDVLIVSAPPAVSGVLSFLSLYSRSEPFLMGQLSYAGVGYFLSVTAAFLLLTVHTLDSRRYRGV